MMPSLLTRPIREVCDQTRVRLRCDDPFPNPFEYTVRGSWIYLKDITGGYLRADMSIIKRVLIENMMSRTITLFEHNQYISILQLLEANAHFPADFFVYDFDFEVQYTLETWIMINAAPLEEVSVWPDPVSVMEFPEIESVSSLHYSTDDDHWLDESSDEYEEDGFVVDDISEVTLSVVFEV